MSMCESLEAALSLSLETFIGKELDEATRLKNEAEDMTDVAESSFAKYLHGKHAQQNASSSNNNNNNNNSSSTTSLSIAASTSTESDQEKKSSSWNKISEGVGNQLGRMRISSSSSNNNNNNHDSNTYNSITNNNNTNASVSPGKLKKLKTGNSLDKTKDSTEKAISVACLKQNLEEMRYAQANAELKRFQLLKHVDALKTRRNFGLGDSVLASLNGIKAYFHHCSNLIQGLNPILQKLHDEQNQLRLKYESQLKPLESREQGLLQAINDVQMSAANAGVVADSICRGQNSGLNTSISTDQPQSLEDIEEETKIWNITQLLTKHSLYIRDQKPTIEVEGWLYKKASTRMAMNTWSKRWFVLDKTGVYYLKGGSLSENGRFGSSNGSLERVKVCDTILCTVRKANNVGVRFCFEIISPNTRPYMLQACGPLEYNKWVLGIRKCLEKQLVHGNVPSDDLLLKKEVPKAKRITKDIFTTQSGDGSNEPIEKSTSYNDLSATEGLSTVQPFRSSSPKDPLIKEILDSNKCCADCGKLQPEWVSLNLGVLICIECSGVHRSLGVHLSKVRSLKLDQLSKAEYILVHALGNDFANSIWESGIGNQKGWTKPGPTDSRKAKEEWIKSKYVWKGFIGCKDSDGKNRDERERCFTRDLHKASLQCDLHATAIALAKGAE